MKCEVCQESDARYKCPACSKQTCSLVCVRNHKQANACSGKRGRSDTVPIREFTDEVLHKDFGLLEDSHTALYRCRASARPDHLRKRDKLKSECYQRAIHLKLLPHVFSVAQENSSTIRTRKDEHGVVTNEILWKVNWRFPCIDKVLSDTCVSESKTILELVTRFFDDTWRLGPTKHLFVGSGLSLETIRVCVVNFQKEEVPVNLSDTIQQALRDQAILEYPTFVISITTAEDALQATPEPVAPTHDTSYTESV